VTITTILDRRIEKKKWTKTRVYTLISLAVMLILVSYRFAFTGNKSTLKVDSERISIASVQKGDFQEYVPVDGIVSPGETIYLDIIQGGMVERVFVEDGTEVKKGDTLAKLSNTNLELEYINRETQMFDIMNNLQNSKATLDKNRIELQKQLMEVNYKIEVLKRRYDVNKELVKGGAISENEYAESKREYDYLMNQKKLTISAYALDSVFIATQMQTLNSGILRMRNNLSAIHKILDQLYITAPVSGQLSSLNATAGELKKPGDKMGQIDVQDYYKIRVNIDERYVAKVYAGQEAIVEYMGKNYELKVSRILPEVKEGTFVINLLFGRAVPEGIKRGQNLPVKVKFGGISEALMIPRGAFYQSSGGNWIYVLDDKQQKAVKRNIRIGRQNAEAYEVLEGLEEGEKVIVSTYKSFNDKDELILNTKKYTNDKNNRP
jgi:HlyD family secretion protein